MKTELDYPKPFAKNLFHGSNSQTSSVLYKEYPNLLNYPQSFLKLALESYQQRLKNMTSNYKLNLDYPQPSAKLEKNTKKKKPTERKNKIQSHEMKKNTTLTNYLNIYLTKVYLIII